MAPHQDKSNKKAKGEEVTMIITKNGHAIAKPVNRNVSAVDSIRGMLKGLSLDLLRFFPVSIASYSLSLNATRL